MEASKAQAKWQLLLELLELSERAYLYKIKKSNPDLSPTEIEEKLNSWYKMRPGAEFGDSHGQPVDPSKFNL